VIVRPGPRTRRVLGVVGRIALLALIAVVALAEVGRAGSAHARDEMLAVGAEMIRMPERPGQAQQERVLFNGAELRVNRGSSPRSVGDVLTAAEAACAESRGPDAEPTTPGAAFRGGDDQRGFVACLDPSLDPERGLLDRVGGMTGEPSLSMPIAYVYAERRGAATQFIGVQSAQPVDLRSLFPREQDAPGRDPAALPRPATSRRALSLRVDGQPYEAAVYLDGKRQLDDLVAHYQEALPQSGWKEAARWRVEEGPGPRQASVIVERAGVLALLLVAQDGPSTSTTFLTMEANREQ
jgi:hypothetical protein